MAELPIPGVGHLPRINEPAPDFEAKTTHGIKSLSDYRGRWLVLFSHPGDFTPVCTSEFVSFAQAYSEFQNLGCELLGLSIDTTYSHIAWIRNIREKFGVDIPFPIIDDSAMRISEAYGMMDIGLSTTSTIRALFVIDENGTLRAMTYYPTSTGRSVAEILRLVHALQTADQYQVATPEGWMPGDPAVKNPPLTVEEADQRTRSESIRCADWYFCEAPVPALMRPRRRTG